MWDLASKRATLNKVCDKWQRWPRTSAQTVSLVAGRIDSAYRFDARRGPPSCTTETTLRSRSGIRTWLTKQKRLLSLPYPSLTIDRGLPYPSPSQRGTDVARENIVLPNSAQVEEVNRVPPAVSREDVRCVVYRLLEEIGDFSGSDLDESASLDSELAMESVTLIELQVALEDHFDVELDPVRIVDLNSLGRIIDYVLAEASAHPRGGGIPKERTR